MCVSERFVSYTVGYATTNSFVSYTVGYVTTNSLSPIEWGMLQRTILQRTVLSPIE